MRSYGRLGTNSSNPGAWTVVQTTPAAGDGLVWFLTLIQNLLLVLGESPFYAQNGIPAQTSIVQQIAPDFYVQLTQQKFAPYFASLSISKMSGAPPTYQVNATLLNGQKLSAYVPST